MGNSTHSKVVVSETQLHLVSGGDAAKAGGNWLNDIPLEDWTDWKELESHFSKTLKKAKRSDLTAAIAYGETTKKAATEDSVGFGFEPPAFGTLDEQLEKAHGIMMVGQMMKAMMSMEENDEQGPTETRSALIAAKDAYTKECLKLADAWKSLLPAALREKVLGLVEMGARKKKGR